MARHGRQDRMIKVGVVGGTGYTGVELLRLLAAHPRCEVAAITSRGGGRREGRRLLSVAARALRPRVHRSGDSAPLKGCDCVFFATPNGVAMSQARALLGVGRAHRRFLRRLPPQGPRDVGEVVQGVARFAGALRRGGVRPARRCNRERIRKARLVANPGCYATAVQLALLPLVETEHRRPRASHR